MRLQIDITGRNRDEDKVYETEYKSCTFDDTNDELYVVLRDKNDVNITFCFGLGTQKKEEIMDIFTKELVSKNNTDVECVSVHVDIARMKIRVGNCTSDFTGNLENYGFMRG